MKWCNLFNCWCDEVEDIIGEIEVMETCDTQCPDCDQCEEVN